MEFPRRKIWLSSRLEEMKSRVEESGESEEKMSKYVSSAVRSWREEGRFSTFYGFNETIGGSEANY